MTTLTIKNIPKPVYDMLKQQASQHHRSLNGEIIFLLEKSLLSDKPNPLEIIKNARKLRQKSAKYLLSEKELTQIKNQGRL